MSNTAVEDYYATVQNQYGLLLGDGFGATEEEAKRGAHHAADAKLATSNPNWKWRKAKVRCVRNPLIGGWIDAAPCSWCGEKVRSFRNAPGAHKPDHKPDCAWLSTVAAKVC